MRRSSALKSQQIAQAIASTGMGAAGNVLGFLDACPDAAPDLIDLIVEEGRRKRPRERLLDTYLLMLAHALEFIRYRVERDLAAGHGQAEAVRQRILAYGCAGELEPAMLLAILGEYGPTAMCPR